ncbi:putative protein kinase TKL-Pl-4 family [Helianthus annuus]|nr:putative protein kinase TKL-Pl-4 family [Helianthus annuus]KAJ0632990.1 putative protein kinase TKL-Pl-4 family [Helianthus annuus]
MILKTELVNTDLLKEFAQEVYILRKVRHKNVVKFIEFMSGGSVYDYLHKQKGTSKLPTLLKISIDISKGMNYLHQNNIIHKDLKAANLLMDEQHEVSATIDGSSDDVVYSSSLTQQPANR